VLFLDELNGSSHEVHKAFYSLILDRRLASCTLHPQSVVIGAGNRGAAASSPWVTDYISQRPGHLARQPACHLSGRGSPRTACRTPASVTSTARGRG
jgi:hypothetical protein